MKKFCLISLVLGIVLLTGGLAIGIIFTDMGYDVDDIKFGSTKRRDEVIVRTTETTAVITEAYVTDANAGFDEYTFSNGDSYSHYYSSAEELRSINIESSSADVYIGYSDQLSVYASNIDPKEFSEAIDKDGALNIAYKKNFGMLELAEDKKPYISVYVPQNCVLSGITVNSAAGDADITDIVTKDLKVELLSGRVSCTNMLITEKADISMAAGSIYLFSSELNDSNISNTAGSIYIDDSVINGSTVINQTAGKLSVNLVGNVSDFTFDISGGSGSFTVNDKAAVPETSGSKKFTVNKTAGNSYITIT